MLKTDSSGELLLNIKLYSCRILFSYFFIPLSLGVILCAGCASLDSKSLTPDTKLKDPPVLHRSEHQPGIKTSAQKDTSEDIFTSNVDVPELKKNKPESLITPSGNGVFPFKPADFDSKTPNPLKSSLSTASKPGKKFSSAEGSPPARIEVELAFDNADLFEVLDATLYELFKINYIIDPHVKAKVSFHFSGKYTQAEFINQLNSVLQLSNLSIAQGPGDIYKVVKKNESGIYLNADVEERFPADSAGDASRMIRLRYIDAATAAKTVKSFASRGASIVTDRVNNALIVTDTIDNINRIAQVVSLMDVEYFNDISWRIFPVTEVDAADIAADITKIVKSTGLYKRTGAVRGGYQIIALKTMNAILVATVWPSIFDLVEKWISAMDHADNTGTGVFVYFVENGTAIELSDILKQLYGEKKSTTNKTQIVKPVETKDKAKNDKTQPPISSDAMSGELSGDVEIIPDETNNAIIFKASQRDYKVIQKVLGELDVVPRQVLINVVVAEVTLNHKTQYGVQWLLKNTMGDYEGQGGFDINETTRVIDQTLGNVTNISYGIYNSADVLKGLVTALGTDSDVNILSSPNVMAVDNQEAYIEVGEDVPTISGSVTNTDGGVTNTIQYRNTGVILKVTPHINSSGLVKMELSQEVSEKGNFDEEIGNYSILTRKAETSLVVHDAQTILMGGMMRQNTNNSDAGVPFLKDIPFLGYLFKSTTKDTTKTELIFLLTPHVVDSRDEVDSITREFYSKIESIKGLIDKEE